MRFRACIAVILATVAVTAVAEPLTHVRIWTADGPRVAAELEHAGFDILWGSVTDESVELIVSARSLDRLRADGFDPVTIAVGQPFREIQAQRIKDAGGDDVPAGYPDYDEVLAEMTAAAAAYPDICQMVNLTETFAQPPTYEGRHMYAVKISDNVTLDEDEPAMLVVGCHHAREISTPTIALHAIEQFTTRYGTDPQITAAVDGNEIWIAPVWNPDGYQYVFDVDNMWRKNRHVFGGGTGVDQNRNYPFGWNTDCSGDTDPGSDIYKGPSAGSENETRTLMSLSEHQRFARVIDYHSSGREALYGYASGCMTHPFNSFVQQEAIALSTASGYGGDTRAPSADGEHFQWQLAEMGAMANLIETHTSFQPSYASAQAEAAMVFPGIMWMLERPTPLWGHITDGLTGEPVEAEITLVGLSFPNGERFVSGGDFGRYYAFLPPGTYDLFVEAEGYDPATVSDVVVTAGASSQMDIALCPPAPLLSPSGGDTLAVNVPTTVTWDISCATQHQIQSTYNYGDVGEIADSFERATVGPNYETGGAAPWQISFSFPLVGSRSVRSGDVSSNETSWMTRTVAGGEVSFWYYVNSEENGDYFNFYVNGTREVHASGATGWQGFSTLLPGERTSSSGNTRRTPRSRSGMTRCGLIIWRSPPTRRCGRTLSP